MREAYFHYANPEHLLVDKRGAAVSGFADACIQADRLVRTMIAAHHPRQTATILSCRGRNMARNRGQTTGPSWRC